MQHESQTTNTGARVMQNNSPVPLFDSKETKMLDIDQLLANMPKDEDELKAAQEKHRQILQENRDKEKARKARNHRLCEHGAILEAYFPQTISMDSAQFAAFMQELAAGR